MNSNLLIPPVYPPAVPRVEFFRLPPPGKRDPHFGLSRSWYYKAAASGEIKLVSVRQRNALRGVRLVVYDSVAAFIRRASVEAGPAVNCEPASGK
jgi:RecA/RadA recombinase